MSAPDSPNAAKGHTAFVPVLAVFLAFLASCAFQTVGLVRQNSELRQANASALQAIPRARLVGAKIQAVTRDLLEMVPTSPGARQIVNEFEIRAASGAR